MPLTHLSIANAKAQAKEYKLADSDALYLAVRPSGAKLWRMNYRHLGRQKTLHLGAWPEVGIAVGHFVGHGHAQCRSRGRHRPWASCNNEGELNSARAASPSARPFRKYKQWSSQRMPRN